MGDQTAAEHVAAGQQRRPQQAAHRHGQTVAHTHQAPSQVGHHQPDKADHARQRNEKRRGQCAAQKGLGAQARHADPHRMGGLLARQQRVQRPPTQRRKPGQQHETRQRNEQIIPARQPQPAERPEQHRTGRPLIAGKHQVAGERAEQKRDRQAADDQLLGAPDPADAKQDHHRQGGQNAAGEGGQRQRQRAQRIAEARDDQHRAGGGAGGEPKQKRIGQLIAGGGLQQRAGHRQPGAGQGRQQRSGHPQLHDDSVQHAGEGRR